MSQELPECSVSYLWSYCPLVTVWFLNKSVLRFFLNMLMSWLILMLNERSFHILGPISEKEHWCTWVRLLLEVGNLQAMCDLRVLWSSVSSSWTWMRSWRYFDAVLCTNLCMYTATFNCMHSRILSQCRFLIYGVIVTICSCKSHNRPYFGLLVILWLYIGLIPAKGYCSSPSFDNINACIRVFVVSFSILCLTFCYFHNFHYQSTA